MAKTTVLPRISGLSGKIMALERRRDFLIQKIREGIGSEGSLQFSRNERDALDSAVECLTYHRAIVDRLDTPLTILREFVENSKHGMHDADLLARAKVVLDEYGA